MANNDDSFKNESPKRFTCRKIRFKPGDKSASRYPYEYVLVPSEGPIEDYFHLIKYVYAVHHVPVSDIAYDSDDIVTNSDSIRTLDTLGDFLIKKIDLSEELKNRRK